MDTKTLFENKKEYLQYIQDLLVEPFIHEFQTIYDASQSRSVSGKVLQEFQSNVGQISQWNHVMIGSMHERIVEQTKCEFLSDLIRAIFVTYVRFHLASHGKLDNIKKIKIRVPNVENFLHKCLISCARIVWKQPYLFYHAVRTIERQHNRVQIEEAFRKAIASTVRNAIPWNQILNITVTDTADVFDENDAVDESDEDDDTVETGTNTDDAESESEPFGQAHPTSRGQREESEVESDVSEDETIDDDDVEEDDSPILDVETLQHEVSEPIPLEEQPQAVEAEKDDESENESESESEKEAEETIHDNTLTEDDVLDALTENMGKMVTIQEENQDEMDTNYEENTEYTNEEENAQHEEQQNDSADVDDQDKRTVTIMASSSSHKKIHKPKLAPRPRVTDAFF